MEKERFEVIRIGVCAYFLILYSCMQLLQKLWYSSAGDSLAWNLIPFAAPALILGGGVYLAEIYKKRRSVFPDGDNIDISAAVRLIGGWSILALIFKYLFPYYLFSMLAGQFALKVYLFPLAHYGLPLIAAAVTIPKGTLKNEKLSSDRIIFLCLRVSLMLICTVSAYQMLVWFGSFFAYEPHEFSPVVLKWIVSGSVIIAIALILLFIPLKLKMNLKNTDGSGYRILIRQSFTLTGFMVLIVGIAELFTAVIHKYDFFDVFFFELPEFLVQLLPAVLLILAGLGFLYFGKKTQLTKPE
jgi:hypothetical protein